MQISDNKIYCLWCRQNNLATKEEVESQTCKSCKKDLQHAKILYPKKYRPKTQIQVGERTYTVYKIDKKINQGHKKNCNHKMSENDNTLTFGELLNLPPNIYKEFRRCERNCGFWVKKIYYLEY